MSLRLSIPQHIAVLLDEHTGKVLTSKDIFIYEDGVVEHAYAVILKKKIGLSGYMVYLPGHAFAGMDGEVEEVEFKSWPPRPRQ